MVGPPKVINKKVNDKVLEPYEVNFQSKSSCYLNIKKEKTRHDSVIGQIWNPSYFLLGTGMLI